MSPGPTIDDMENNNKPSGYISNQCECTDHTDWAGEIPSYDCHGCWDDNLDFFTEVVTPLLEETGATEWEMEFPTWRGTVRGIANASNALELLRALTPDRTEWSLEYVIEGSTISGILYHHDVPMGGRVSATAIINKED